MRKVTFPRMGVYTEAFEYLVKELGFEPITPPPITQDTIKLGVRHSSNMVCFPFKCCLGCLIQGLEKGADSIIVTGIQSEHRKETCRFGFYFYVMENILKRLGYKFDVLRIRWRPFSVIRQLKKLNPNLNTIKVLGSIKRTMAKIEEIERKNFTFEKKDVNIGMVGEAFTLWANEVNYDIVKKLKKMGIGVHMSITLSWFLKHQLHLVDTKKYLHKEAKKYFIKKIGGHGFESVYNSIYYAKNGFDGIIHLLPLSCMPETLVEMSINHISEDYHIPVYRFPIDESRFEAGFDTRLETFIKLLKRNKITT